MDRTSVKLPLPLGAMERLPERQSFPKKLSTFTIVSYASDYLVLALLVIAIAILDHTTPFHQPFSLRNYNLQYPFAVHERVPVWLLYTCSIAIPAVIVAVYTLLIDGLFSHRAVGYRRRYSWRQRLWEFNCAILGLLMANAAAYVIVGIFKIAIGKPRPDLIDRCQPRVTTDPQPFGLSNFTICTQTDKSILDDGFKSFPSGHSCSSFSGLLFLSLYLAGKLHINDMKGLVWRIAVVATPVIGAGLIAGTRIMDARHHPFDVIFGSLLGVLIAWMCYRQYFPPLSDWRAKGKAYRVRNWGARLGEATSPRASSDYMTAPLHDEENDVQGA